MTRPSLDAYFLRMAELVASRGTCPRRRVGAVLVDVRGRVLATGYNGAPAGLPHCLDVPCPGATAPPGEALDRCEAIHAEQNAIAFCPDIERVWTAYVTASPCVSCVKLLINTGCRRVVFLEAYPHPHAEDLWRRARFDWDEPDPWVHHTAVGGRP